MMQWSYLGSKHLNSEHVQCLTANVFCPHVNDALHTKTSTDSSSSYSMLTGTSLSDDPSLSNPACEKYLCANVLDDDLPGSKNREPTCPMALLILWEPVWFL